MPEYVDGYVETIPPCIWSEAEGDGLPKPPVLTPETRLMSVARYDSLHKGHLGVMASWQCRAMYALPHAAAESSQHVHVHPPPRRRRV